MNTQSVFHPRILRLKQLAERIGLGRSTIYDRMDVQSPRYDATFPKPIKLGAAAIGWIDSDITAWIEQRVSAKGVVVEMAICPLGVNALAVLL